MAHQLYAEAF